MRQHAVAAFDVTRLAFLLQKCLHVRLLDREVRVDQRDEVDDLVVAEIEHVADAAQCVVVDHRGSGKA
jgi:hypothetical protein